MAKQDQTTRGAARPDASNTAAAEPATSQRGVHDLGGLAAGQVDTHEHAPSLTERRIDALMGLMRDNKRGFWKTDENRRTIESMTPQMYEGSGYYERWVLAMRSLLVEKGVLTQAEITARLDAVRARHVAVPAADAPLADKPDKPDTRGKKDKT